MPSKTCRCCHAEKPADDFAKRSEGGRRTECRECMRAYKKVNGAARHEDPDKRAMALLARAKARAKRKGLKCTLTLSWVQAALAVGVCQLTGEAFSLKPLGGKQHPYSPSIDRIKSGGDYTPANCRVITTRANVALNAWSLEQFEKFAVKFLMARNPKLFVKPKRAKRPEFTFSQGDLFVSFDSMDALRVIAESVEPPKKRLTAKPALSIIQHEQQNHQVANAGGKRARHKRRGGSVPAARRSRSSVAHAARGKSNARPRASRSV
jgi:hypothetical protein